MEFYLIFLFLLLVPGYALAQSRGAAWYMVSLIFLISAMRYKVGFDYETYFEWAQHGIDPYLAVTMEPLSKEMLKLSLYSGEPQYFFVLSSMIVVGLFGFSYIRCSQLPALSLLAFFCLPLQFLVSLAVIRQSMAAAVVFFAITVLEKRKKTALILLLVAGLLHYSAWIIIPFWLCLGRFDRPVATGWYLAALIIAPLLSLILPQLILPYLPLYSYYSETEGTSGLKLAFLYYLIALGVLWLRYRGAVLPNRPFNFFMLGVLLFVLTVPFNQVIGRIAYFFMPFGSLLLPACISRLRPVSFTRLLVVVVLGCVFFVQLFMASQNPELDPYLPYRFYLGWF